MNASRQVMSWRRIGLVLVAGLAIGAALVWPGKALLEAWLLAFVGLTGVGIGALGLLMVGHLAGDYWLHPIRPQLEAAALTLPLSAALSLPLILHLSGIYPWAASDFSGAGIPEIRLFWLQPVAFLIRGGVCLALWCGLALLLSRPGHHFGLSIIGLVVLTPTATVASIDWVMSRDPAWWSSLFGFAFALTQLLPVLAAAILVRAFGGADTEPHRLRSLEQVLLTLALLTGWIWFVQFLIIWMADLPDESAWYLRRYESFGGLMFLVALPALVLGIVLLALPRIGGPVMIVAVILLVVQHAVHLIWLVRPSTGAAAIGWMDAVVAPGLVLLWGLWAAETFVARPPEQEPDPAGIDRA